VSVLFHIPLTYSPDRWKNLKKPPEILSVNASAVFFSFPNSSSYSILHLCIILLLALGNEYISVIFYCAIFYGLGGNISVFERGQDKVSISQAYKFI
jgi:hypothetical protein